jgi:uncharacterized protein YyaL (SSP411 family)
VIAYSDPKAMRREVRGILDDYAFTAVACLDAYEVSADLSYFKFAKNVADAMIKKFFDPVSGGFVDAEATESAAPLGILSTRRKPFQDSPTPAGNSVAAIALLRLHAYTNNDSYREKAEQTLEIFAGKAEQYGIFAATYGIAARHCSEPHAQVVVIGEGEQSERLLAAGTAQFAFNKTVIRLSANEAVAQNLPPALAATIPNLPGIRNQAAMAVVCSGSSCLPPVTEAEQLERVLRQSSQPAA